ncbi:MAG: hypothetical protein D6731_21315, partial [Planctomycetota bacterium]
MRILSVTVHNLASLAGTTTVDFENGPLAAAPTFAITGPKGAGKTTLLDAVCLALYGRTPRLGARTRDGYTVEGSGKISSHDPRSIVRRGCGEGWAEVVFLGRDRVRYRARWSARRARRQATGRFQKAEHALWAADDGTPLSGSTRTETLARIEDKVGLSYEEFTRSVLLAQGEFAAFLRAPAGKRAELLEKISGGELYTRLSIAAHQRARQEKEKLDQLERKLADATPLTPAERAQVEAEAEKAERRLKEAERRLAHLERAERWYQELAAREKQWKESREHLARAEGEWKASRDLAAELEAVRRAGRHRHVLAAKDEAESRHRARKS